MNNTMAPLDTHDLEPLPLDEVSPKGVTEEVPFLEAARTKKGAAKKRPSAGRADRRPNKRRSLSQDEEEKEEQEDDEDEKEDDSDDRSPPQDSDMEEEEVEEGGEGILIQGEIRDSELPGCTGRGDPLFWFLSYRRNNNKGAESIYLAGCMKFSNRARASVWARMYAEQVHGIFRLSTFVENFVDFARAQPTHGRFIFTVPNLPVGEDGNPPERQERPPCPLPDYDPSGFVKVQVRNATAGELGIRSGVVPKAAWKVTVEHAPGGYTEWFTAWSVWAVRGLSLGNLIKNWEESRPNARLQAVEDLINQVRTPHSTTVMTPQQLTAAAQAINFEPPQAGGNPAAPPMDAL